MRDDRACLTHWNRRLASVAPTPRTRVVLTEPDLRGDELIHLLDGNVPPGYESFMDRLRKAVALELADAGGIGPVFLRTGHSAFKHEWRHTCGAFPNVSLEDRVARMVDLAAGDSFPDVHPLGVWCVREMLPTTPVAILDAYGGLPLVPEVRAFVGGGSVRCVHSYWPPEAIENGLTDRQKDALSAREMFNVTLALGGMVPIDAIGPAFYILTRVAKEFAADGEWSVDLLDTDRGWHAIDMAPAERSWHDPTCPRSTGAQLVAPPAGRVA